MSQVFSAVKAIILNDKNKILVIKQNVLGKELYDLPGGKVHYGESPYDTLKREVKEEVDLDIDILKPLGMWWFFRAKDSHQVVCNTFLCKPSNLNIDISKNPADEDIREFSWVSKEEFRELNVSHDSLKELVQKV